MRRICLLWPEKGDIPAFGVLTTSMAIITLEFHSSSWIMQSLAQITTLNSPFDFAPLRSTGSRSIHANWLYKFFLDQLLNLKVGDLLAHSTVHLRHRLYKRITQFTTPLWQRATCSIIPFLKMKGAETRAEKLSGSFRRDSMLDITLGAATMATEIQAKWWCCQGCG